MTHHHACKQCGVEFECSAPIANNYDGVPERVCILVLEEGDQYCEDCLGSDAIDYDPADEEADEEGY